jgi:hypothetical protein
VTWVPHLYLRPLNSKGLLGLTGLEEIEIATQAVSDFRLAHSRCGAAAKEGPLAAQSGLRQAVHEHA